MKTIYILYMIYMIYIFFGGWWVLVFFCFLNLFCFFKTKTNKQTNNE